MNYHELLEHSYQVTNEHQIQSRLAYLGEYIFDFTTYDDSMSELFAAKALEVSDAISTATTFEYIKLSEENYRWYLLMCNMPFFAPKLEWGTSVRGAWWNYAVKFTSFGLWDEDRQMLDELTFSQKEWVRFMSAILEFAKKEN